MFAAPNYFSLNDTDGNVDIVTKFVNNFSIIYTQPSGDESLPIALSGQCANENITNSSLSKLGANFNSEFNSRFNQYFKSGSSLNFLQLPTQSPGFISSNVSRDIILGKSFKLNELPFNRVFFAKVACQLCKDSNSQNMASKNMSFSDYVTSNNTPNICSAAIKEELTNCYNEDKGWNDPGKLEGLQNAISEKNFAIDVQFSDLLVLLNIASSSKSPVASSNIFQQFGGSQSTDSGSNQQDKSSISYIRNQYECYIKGKWNAYMDIINNDLANQGVAPPPSSEELGKISDIFSKSNLNKMLEQSSFSLGGLNFGVGAVMTMLGSIVSLFAEDIVSPQSNNILSIIQNTSPFPLIGISKKGNEIAQKMEEIVQWMIPGYPLILGGKKLIDLIANIKVQDGSNFWDTITKMFAGIGAVVGVVAGIFLATQSGAWKVISKILEFQLYALMLVIAIAAPFYMAALTMFYLPIIPVVIFMYAIFAWFMTVVEAVVAAPILAIGLMHPSGQDEVFGKSEVGLLMLINAMLRPMLIIIGFVSAFIFFKIAFVIYNLFFGAMLNYLEITSIGAYITFVGSYVGGMIPLVTRVYGLTNQIPENVMTWIGGTHAGSRGEATEALQGSRAGAQAAPGEAAGLGKAAAGSGAAFAQAGVGLYDSIKNSPASKGNEPKPK